MSQKIFCSGEIVEESGLYPVVGPRGGDKGYEVTAVKGEPFPPLPEKGWGFGEPRLAKTTASNSSEEIVMYSPPELPENRPMAEGHLTLVPSETLPSGRPVLVGTRQVSSYDHLPHHRPVFQSDLNIVAMYGNRPVISLDSSLTPSASLPENRPMAEGHLTLVPSETLPSGRPVLVGTRQVSSYDHLPHHRPVFQSDLNIVAMYGNRPVISLDSSLTPSASLPENRPIADNKSLSSGKLMGYLD